MPALADLLAFNVAASDVSLWVSRGPRGAASEDPSYPVHWVGLTQPLQAVLKDTIITHRGTIADVQQYGMLAANLDGEAMTIPVDETHAPILTASLAAQLPGRRVQDTGDLFNSSFYVIKLVHGQQILYAVRKADSLWQTKKALNVRTTVFRENELTIDNDPRFDISTTIDFYIVGDEVIISHKGHFETILRYKQAHREAFAALRAEPEFQGIFVDLAPLVSHVGVNKIQLRRASAIQQKGHYRDAMFMNRLRTTGAQYGFNIAFDADGRIIVTPETCAEIMTALLDHRLSSGFSQNIYDVPSARVINT